MILTQIKLENVGVYAHRTFSLSEGVNLIRGTHGAGKTILLKAVGYVLFDYPSHSPSDLIREGGDTARVGVHFVSARDGMTYQVVREWGASFDYYACDPWADIQLAWGTADVAQWLRVHLGLGPEVVLGDLFSEVVGVPSGYPPGFLEQGFDGLLSAVGFAQDRIGKTTRAICLRADDLLNEILGQGELHLTWTEAEGIALYQKGKVFSPGELSDGVRTAAVLALRLALLEQLPGVGIALLDEPTSSLDGAGKDGLVRALLRVNLSQAIVLSCESLFERAADHVLEISEEGEESTLSIW